MNMDNIILLEKEREGSIKLMKLMAELPQKLEMTKKNSIYLGPLLLYAIMKEMPMLWN